MRKLCIYLLLILKFSAGSYYEYEDFIPGEEYDDLENLTVGITNIFGIWVSGHLSNEICVSGDSFVIPKDEFYCFKTNEITNITKALYKTYTEAEEHGNGIRSINITSLALLSLEIPLFNATDYLLMWKCIKSLEPVIDVNYINILKNLLSSPYAGYSLLQILEHIFINPNVFSTKFIVANSDLVLMVWHPFENISGVALYENIEGDDPYWIRTIYNNESSNDIVLENLKIAGYVPQSFLEKQFANTQNDVIIMIMIMNGEKYNQVLGLHNGVENYIGIGMPGQCKKNYEPLLKAHFRPEMGSSENKWIEFGEEYFDSLEDYDWYTCSLSTMAYFGEFPLHYSKNKGVKISQSCLIGERKHIMDSFFVVRTDVRLYEEILESTEATVENFFERILNISLDSYSLPRQTKFTQQVNTIIWGKIISEAFPDEITLQQLRYLQKPVRRGDICLFNFIYNYFDTSKPSYFETVKEEYCMERIDANGLKWRQTPIFNEIYPDSICLDRNLHLLSRYCYANGIFQEASTLGGYKECINEHPFTENTKGLYQILMQCSSQGGTCEDGTSLIKSISSYVDVALLQKYFSISSVDIESHLDLFEYALPLVKTQVKDEHQLQYLSSFMFFFYNLPVTRPDILKINMSFMFVTLSSLYNDRIGWAFFKEGEDSFLNYDAKPLSIENATENHLNNEDLEVAFFVSCVHYTNCTDYVPSIDAFVIYDNEFCYSEDHPCKSRIITFLNKKSKEIEVNMTVYLKIINGGKGFWSTINVRFGELTMVFLSETRDNLWASSINLSIFRTHLARRNDSQENIESNIEDTITDLLSQLVVSLTSETRSLHDGYSQLLKNIIFTTTSVLVLILILISIFVIIKCWHKKHFCSIGA